MEGVSEAPAPTNEPPPIKRPSEKNKVPRKRMRKLFASIREQMEFYFSDSNLRRDRYLRREIEQGVDGYVPLTLFQNFNKMKEICTDPATIAKALRKCSTLLEVSDDGLRLRRKAPVPNESQADIDSRTVYVECLPQHVDHEWVKTVFSGFGRIAYISLPRWKTSGDPKGFTFVEYEAVDGAQKCCEAFQGSGDFGAAHCFPKGSKQLLQLQRRAATEGVPVELQTSMPPATAAAVIADEVEGSDAKDGEAVATSRKSKRKRKRAKTETEEADEQDDDEQNRENGQKPKKQCKKDLGGGSSSSGKPAAVEFLASATSADATTAMHDLDSAGAETEAAAGHPAEGVRDSVIADASDSEPQADTDAMSSEDETGEGKKSSRRNRKNRKSKKMKADKSEHQLELDMLKLKVIPKSQWLRLRSEYLNLQKLNMAALKRALQLHAGAGKPPSEGAAKQRAEGDGTCEAAADADPPKPALPPIEFVPGVIAKVACTKGTLTHKSVKAILPACVEVAYIDITDGASDGFIRCKDQASAELLCSTASVGDFTFTALQGSEEQAYWNKLRSDREQKRNQKRSGSRAVRKKQRGAQKIAAKAEKMTAKTMAAATGSTLTAGSTTNSQLPNRHTRF